MSHPTREPLARFILSWLAPRPPRPLRAPRPPRRPRFNCRDDSHSLSRWA